MKKLYKSNSDKVVGGVLAGISEYYNVDATVARLIFLFLIIITGFFPGLLFYIIAMLIMPDKHIVQ